MSKCEFINLVLDSEFNSEDMHDALELLESNCEECNNPVCTPEEVQDIESLIDVIEEIRVDEAEDDGLNLCENCAAEYELNKELYLSGEKILELCPKCYELYKEYDEEEHECNNDVIDAETLIGYQEVEKENLRIEALYGEVEIEENDLTSKAKSEAESLGVFFRELIRLGLNTTEAYNLTLNRQTLESNLEQTKIQQVVGMTNQI